MGATPTKKTPEVYGTSQRSQLLRIALDYADQGIPVFPCKPGGKAPLTEHGYKDASTDPSRIHVWWHRWPEANIGIPTGARSGIIVVDVDGPEGRAEAERLGLRSGYVVRTGRERDGWHLYFTIPPGGEVVSRTIAPGLELKAGGCYVVGPSSLHPSGAVYRVVKNGEPSLAPMRLIEAGAKPERTADIQTNRGAVSVDVAGEPILDGERNCTLARIAGRLHDGTRTLDALTRDLLAINDARCTPPLPPREVERIATSIHGRSPCKPSPNTSPHVLATVEYLRETAEERPVRGMAGASGWSIYHAGLDACERFGREHPEGIALSLDVRTWAQMAGTEGSTVSRWIRRSPLIKVLDRGSGRRSMTVLFVAPEEIGGYLQHSSTRWVSQERNPSRSVATDPLLRTLYRSRWSKRTHTRKRGLVSGTRMVRQSPQLQGRDGIQRMGPSQAALLWKIRTHPNASRAELATMLGVKPDSLKKRLRKLITTGMIVRTSRGHYAPAPDLERRVEDARELGEEPEADRLQIAQHERERDAYRRRNETRADRAPTEFEMCQRRDSYPERRRVATERAILRLFAERPEYRARRVGQITAALVHYIGPDFPRGPDGVPQDAEVEAILDGCAA